MLRNIPYRMSEGSWQPARLRWIDHVIIMVGLIVIAYTRGLDYIIGSDVWGARDFMLAAAPAWVWGGVGFLTGASILAFGVTTHRHLAVCIGHGWLGATYACNALALGIAPGPNGWSAAFIFGGVAITTLFAIGAHRLVVRGRGTLAFILILLTVATHAASMEWVAHFDGVRGAGAVGLIAVLHFIHMIRTGGRPLRIKEGHASESVFDGGRA